MRKLRWILVLALLVMGVASTVQSMPQNGIYIEYYSDDSYSEVVGYTYHGCSGNSSDGIRTNYRRFEQESCNTWNEFYDCHYLICQFNIQTGQEDCVVNGYCD